MRGDRPDFDDAGIYREMATPYARGSTRTYWPKTLGLRGYPVCAGIDPSTDGRDYSEVGLPRMRGDRPADLLA